MEQKLTYEEWIAQQFRDLEATIKGIPDALEAHQRAQSRTEFLTFYGKDEYSAYLNDFNFEVREGMKFFIKPYKGLDRIPDAKFSWKALIPLGLDTPNKEIPHFDLPRLPDGDISIVDAFMSSYTKLEDLDLVKSKEGCIFMGKPPKL